MFISTIYGDTTTEEQRVALYHPKQILELNLRLVARIITAIPHDFL
jgi:hypothetical protein